MKNLIREDLKKILNFFTGESSAIPDCLTFEELLALKESVCEELKNEALSQEERLDLIRKWVPMLS